MIKVENLVKKYGNKLAVNDISFTINKGEIVGFLGPNGAGKSTTMNMLTGYLSSTSGTIEIDGIDILNEPIKAKSKIGFLPEIPPLYTDMTVKEYLNFVYDLRKCKLPRNPHLDEICTLVGIKEVYTRVINNLSKGYKQRVGFAQALIGNPEILILDEPTVGFDPKQIIEIRNLIKKLGKNHTIILSSHILPEVSAVCERIIVINKGVIVADDKTENLSQHFIDKNSVTIVIEGQKDDVINIFANNPAVKSIECAKENEGKCEFNIIGHDNVDIRKTILLEVANNNLNMLELKKSSMSLEEIFLELVTKENIYNENKPEIMPKFTFDNQQIEDEVADGNITTKEED